MITFKQGKTFSFRCIASAVLITFISSFITPYQTYAQSPADLGLPKPGTMISLSSNFAPVMVKGLRVHPENPILFDFLVDSGNANLNAESNQLKEESNKLIKYFLASLTIPEDKLWVNLSPYEKDRIIPQELGLTEMGRDMLAQDYMLKQLTASLIYPEKDLGREFWNKVYAKAQAQFGTAQIPVNASTALSINTFNKVWIVADKAKVYVRDNTAFVVGAQLKVMLEEDYLARDKNLVQTRGHVHNQTYENVSPGRLPSEIGLNAKATQGNPNAIGSQIIREVVLPALETEVNQGKTFANLRQIFHSMILAAWYKKNLKEALLNQVYSNKAKINGVDTQDKTIKDQIYQEYLKAYKKGVFNYIKEDIKNAKATPRKYFSGGVLGKFNLALTSNLSDPDVRALRPDGAMFAITASTLADIDRRQVEKTATDYAMSIKNSKKLAKYLEDSFQYVPRDYEIPITLIYPNSGREVKLEKLSSLWSIFSTLNRFNIESKTNDDEDQILSFSHKKLYVKDGQIPVIEIRIDDILPLKGYQFDQFQLNTLVDSFKKNFKDTFDQQEGQRGLSYYDSFFSPLKGMEEGNFIGVDFSGTNLKFVILNLKKGAPAKLVYSTEEPIAFPEELKKGSNQPIFDFVAKKMKELPLESNVTYSVGLSFAFPMIHRSRKDAVVKQNTKGWQITDITGKNPSQLLQDALNKHYPKDNPFQVKALVNDTIATHLSSPMAQSGVILGTGFNLSLFDRSLRKIINLEAGNLKVPPIFLTKPDLTLFHHISPINERSLEKMISGEYLIQIFRYQIEGFNSLPESGFDKILRSDWQGVKSALLSELEHAKDVNSMSRMINETLKGADVVLTQVEFELLKSLAFLLLQRAGQVLAAVVYSGLSQTVGLNDNEIVIDGSVYWENKTVKDAFANTMSILRKGENDLKVHQIKNASATGAALAAAVATNDKEMNTTATYGVWTVVVAKQVRGPFVVSVTQGGVDRGNFILGYPTSSNPDELARFLAAKLASVNPTQDRIEETIQSSDGAMNASLIQIQRGVEYWKGNTATSPITRPFRASKEHDVMDITTLQTSEKQRLERLAIESLIRGEGTISMLVAGASSRMSVKEAPAAVKAMAGEHIESKAGVPIDIVDGKAITYLDAFGINLSRLFKQIAQEATSAGVDVQGLANNDVLLLSNNDYWGEHQGLINAHNNYGLAQAIRAFMQPLEPIYWATVEDVKKQEPKEPQSKDFDNDADFKKAQAQYPAKVESFKRALAFAQEVKDKFVAGDHTAILANQQDPLGHGEFFHQLVISGELLRMFETGKKWFFVKNVDNYAAKLDRVWLEILGRFLDQKVDFQPEVSVRAPGQKGGSLVVMTDNGSQQLAEDPTLKATVGPDGKPKVSPTDSFWFNDAVAFGRPEYVASLYFKDGQNLESFLAEYKAAFESGNKEALEEIAQRGRAKFPKLVDPKPAKDGSGKITAKIETNMWQSTGVAPTSMKISSIGVRGASTFDIDKYPTMSAENRLTALQNLRFLATKQWVVDAKKRAEVKTELTKAMGRVPSEAEVDMRLESFEGNRHVAGDLLNYILHAELITKGILTDNAMNALPRVSPTTTQSWAELVDLAQQRKQQGLRELFGQDPNRARKLTVALNGDVQVDFSKNLIDENDLKALIGLAREVKLPIAIEQMFSGEKINETENRAVLHTALRNVKRDTKGKLVAANVPVLVDGQDVMPKVIAVLNQVEAFTKKIQSGEWKGASGKRIKNIINVGIGGSDLGPKMAVEALKPFKAGDVDAYFLSNIDGTAAAELMKKLDPEETLVVIVSKTFTTQETMQNAQTMKNWVLKAYHGDQEAIKRHFVAVSTAKDLVTKFGIDPANMFEFWDWVGGRYSMWSAVGLTLATYIGFDNFLQFLEGGREADEHFRTKPLSQNIPVIKALLNVWYGNFLGAESFAILPYDQNLGLLPAFAQQFFMESNGKSVDREGKFVDYQTGLITWGAAGTDGQHSFYQLIHQGTPFIPADFIGVLNTHNPVPGHHEKFNSNLIAQTEALAFGATQEEVKAELVADPKNNGLDIDWHSAQRTFAGNKPTTTILLDQVTPRTLGNLVAMYEHQIFTEGIIWNIFSFDQWGVELGKKVATKKVLPFLDGTRPLTELPQSGLSESSIAIVEKFMEANFNKVRQWAKQNNWDDTVVKNVIDWYSSNAVNAKQRQALLRLIREGKADKIKAGFSSPKGVLQPGTAGTRAEMETFEEDKIGPNYFSETTVIQYTWSFVNWYKSNGKTGPAFIAKEVRDNSDTYGDVAAKILLANGIPVVRINTPVSTPFASYLAKWLANSKYGIPAFGYQISASHNKFADNGIKFMGEFGQQFMPTVMDPIAEGVPSLSNVQKIAEMELKSHEGYRELTGVEFNQALDAYFSEIDSTMAPEFKALVKQHFINGGQQFVFTPLNGASGDETKGYLSRLGLQEGVHYFIPAQEALSPQQLPTKIYADKRLASSDPANDKVLAGAREYAEAKGINMVIARDPDGDRFVIAMKIDGVWKKLDGNQNAILMTHDRLSNTSGDKSKMLMMRSHATTTLLDKIAAKFGIKTVVVPVGFKYFGAKVIQVFNSIVGKNYFGAEESYGTSNGHINEKDGLSGMANMLLIVARKAKENKNVFDYLNDIYKEFGFPGDSTINIPLPGTTKPEQEKAKANVLSALKKLKAGDYFGDYEIVSFKDKVDIEGLGQFHDGYDFILKDREGKEFRLLFRASGTEPIFKAYFSWQNPITSSTADQLSGIISESSSYVLQTKPKVEATFKVMADAAMESTVDINEVIKADAKLRPEHVAWLAEHGITTLRILTAATEQDIRRMVGFTQTRLNAIKGFLSKRGLSLSARTEDHRIIGGDSGLFLADDPNAADQAAVSGPGGIDLNSKNLQLDINGEKINIKFDQAMINQFKRGDFTGVRPVILKITPIMDVRPLLGLAPRREENRLAQV